MKKISWLQILKAFKQSHYLYWDKQLFYKTEDDDESDSIARFKTTGENQTEVTIEIHKKHNRQVMVENTIVTVRAYVSWEDNDTAKPTKEHIVLLNPVNIEFCA